MATEQKPLFPALQEAERILSAIGAVIESRTVLAELCADFKTSFESNESETVPAFSIDAGMDIIRRVEGLAHDLLEDECEPEHVLEEGHELLAVMQFHAQRIAAREAA